MKHRFLYIMALLLTVAAGAMAQSTDPDPIDLTYDATTGAWTYEQPAYDTELEVTYYTDEEVAAMEEAAFTEGVELTYDEASDAWTLAETPGFDIELEVEYETALALNEEDDNTEKLTKWNGFEADVTLTRTLVKEMWNTIALPFSISSADLITLNTIFTTMGGSISFKELKSSSFNNANGELTLTFDNANEVNAGQPYLVKVSKELNFATLPASIDAAIAANSLPITNPFKGVIISKAIEPVETAAVDFIPTLGKTTITGSDAKSVLFLASGNTLKNPTVLPSDMKGFRAYFQLKGEAATARAFKLNLGDGESTGITSIEQLDNLQSDDWYDLSGRKIVNGQSSNRQMNKGVYIVKGKKVIIK